MIAKKIALGVAIAVVFPMMLHYGVSTYAAPRPNLDDYFAPASGLNAAPEERNRFIAEQIKRADDDRRAAEKRFGQHLFAVAVPLGLVAILCGALVRAQATGTGLMFGGIFSICDGYFNYWSELADFLKFVSLLVAFLLLLFVGYRKLEKKEI